MEQLLIAVLGAFAGWVFLRSILPFRIPHRLAPVIIAGLAYGVLMIPSFKIQLAVAAVAGVSLLHRVLADAEFPGPWKLPRFRPQRTLMPWQRQAPEEPTGQGFRTSGEPGRRIPTL